MQQSIENSSRRFCYYALLILSIKILKLSKNMLILLFLPAHVPEFIQKQFKIFLCVKCYVYSIQIIYNVTSYLYEHTHMHTTHKSYSCTCISHHFSNILYLYLYLCFNSSQPIKFYSHSQHFCNCMVLQVISIIKQYSHSSSDSEVNVIVLMVLVLKM